ncbi:MAG TPA: type II secretion system F family protein [Arenimonas sp.]|nr:MAG: hypothetical protein A2X76_04125 [Xanthomonadales bacterium GWF1_69_6]HBD20982.1 type II secretion system F family protein [Arenimonas sp.]
MHRYDYRVLSADGSVLSGSLRAASEREAARQLERRGLTPLSLERHAGAASSGKSTGKIRTSDLILALHQTSTMLLAGVSIAEVVDSQASSAPNARLATAFAGIAAELRRGESFHDALVRARLPLPAYLLQLAKAGELTGRVGEALADGVRQMEYEESLRTEMRNALIYPAVLVLAGVAAVVMMFVFVVPKFASLLEKADQLPLLAWLVLSVGTWANDYWYLVLAAALGVAGVAWRVWSTPQWRLRLLESLTGLPLVGPMLVDAEIGRWAKMMGTLLDNRVPLIQALELSADGTPLPQQRQRLTQVARSVRGGQTLADSLEDQDALNATGYNLVRVGERSGELPAMLQSLARLYDEAGRTRMKRLLILIEPVAILLIGGVIGTIILGVILAITSANDLAV